MASKKTSKDFVKEKYPTAYAQKHQKYNQFMTIQYYWLIRKLGDTYYLGEGKTEAQAWQDAKEKITNFN